MIDLLLIAAGACPSNGLMSTPMQGMVVMEEEFAAAASTAAAAAFGLVEAVMEVRRTR